LPGREVTSAKMKSRIAKVVRKRERRARRRTMQMPIQH
jgi:hypothetical protein